MNAAFVEALQSKWTNKDLATINDFFGRPMPNSIFLMTLINHQNHHRGQMTVLMRQAGLTVPGVYGPAKEEWVALEWKLLKCNDKKTRCLHILSFSVTCFM